MSPRRGAATAWLDTQYSGPGWRPRFPVIDRREAPRTNALSKRHPARRSGFEGASWSGSGRHSSVLGAAFAAASAYAPIVPVSSAAMRVAVLGAGITGLATAWYLLEDGHEVTVVDKNAGPGLGTSYANGAQLSYSYVAPLAGPGVLPKIPPWLLRRDSPLRFYPALDLHQWRWLLEFVLACNQAQSDVTTRRLLRLSFYSRALMHAFVASAPGATIDFGYARNGKLVVYSDVAGFESARRLALQRRRLRAGRARCECVARARAGAADPAGSARATARRRIHTRARSSAIASVLVARRSMKPVADVLYDPPVEHRASGAGSHTIAALEPARPIEADRYCSRRCGSPSSSGDRTASSDLPLKGYSITFCNRRARRAQHHRLSEGGLRPCDGERRAASPREPYASCARPEADLGALTPRSIPRLDSSFARRAPRSLNAAANHYAPEA